VDLRKTFGISFREGEDQETDSSDAEFTPEDEKIDSEGRWGKQRRIESLLKYTKL